MIVPTMSFEEIAEQYKGDMDNLLAKRHCFQPKFESLVKKSRRFPVTAQYEYISHTNRNRYIYNYSASKRGEWNRPRCTVFGIFDKPEGKFVITSANRGSVFIIYTPHFFARYRERIIKDDSINGTELIKRYFKENDRLVFEKLTESHTLAYRKYEKSNGEVMAARIKEGNIFLKALSSSIIIAKTIVSDDMLYESQTKAFERMKNQLERVNKITPKFDSFHKERPFQKCRKEIHI